MQSNKSSLLELCEKLPSTDQSLCKQFVTKYPTTVVQIAQEVVKKLVEMLPFGHCNVGMSVVVPKTEADATTAGCAVCKDFVQILNYALKQSDIKKQLKALLGEECAKLPAAYAPGVS